MRGLSEGGQSLRNWVSSASSESSFRKRLIWGGKGQGERGWVWWQCHAMMAPWWHRTAMALHHGSPTSTQHQKPKPPLSPSCTPRQGHPEDKRKGQECYPWDRHEDRVGTARCHAAGQCCPAPLSLWVPPALLVSCCLVVGFTPCLSLCLFYSSASLRLPQCCAMANPSTCGLGAAPLLRAQSSVLRCSRCLWGPPSSVHCPAAGLSLELPPGPVAVLEGADDLNLPFPMSRHP